MKKLLFLLALPFVWGCESDEAFVVEGYKPVYVSKATMMQIYSSGPMTLVNPGKIYMKDSYIYIGEKGKGVHVINNSDPANPVKIAFINIPGVKDVAIKGNYMYADNLTDLVTIDISDVSNVVVLDRIPGVYPAYNQLYPEETECYFECADTTQGYVLEWVYTELTDPQCQR